MLWNIPIFLTVLRIALIPVFIRNFYLQTTKLAWQQFLHWVNVTAAWVFALAAYTPIGWMVFGRENLIKHQTLAHF